MKVRNVLSIIYLVVIFIIAKPAYAEEWISYATPDTGKMFYDKSSIKKIDKDIFLVWTISTFNDVGKARASSFINSMNKVLDNSDMLAFESRLQEIDCANNKIRISSSSIYNKKREVVFSLPKNVYGEWQKIIPKSTSEALKNIVCNDARTKKK